MHSAIQTLRWVPAYLLGLALLAGCAANTPAQGPAAQVSPLDTTPAASAAAPAASPIATPAATEAVTATAAPAGAVAPIAAPTAVTGEGAAAATAAKAQLAAKLNVSPDTIQVTGVEAKEWPDACLGVTSADEMCAAVITPGYIVTLDAGGKTYTYHTDATGNAVKEAPNAESSGKGSGPQTPPVTGTVTDTVTGTTSSAGDSAAAPAVEGSLQWTGPAELGSSDTSQCAQMSISSGQATLTGCDGTSKTVPLGSQAVTFATLAQRLAPFSMNTATEAVTFQGAGTDSSPAWQRAVLAWARVTHAELASGRTSATARTAMSWNLGRLSDKAPDKADICAHLTVLDYGYAYAEQRPCAGGNVISTANGWLENAELDQFDQWLYANAPLSAQDNYLNGVGKATFDPAQTPVIAAWAKQVWTRLAGAATAASNACSPAAGSTAYVSTAYGFCLLLPADYQAVETAPGSITLVRGGDVTNDIDPRIGIEVTDAGTRTLPQVAQQLVSDYAGNNAVEPQGVSVDAVDAVMLDNLPGQDLNRRIAVIHNGKLYNLMFTPLSAEAEPFYQAVLGSFRFLK